MRAPNLNAICPYFTMFPLDFPYRVLANNATLGDVVLDPFCGRGTTNLAARLLGHTSLGIDSNPVATAIAQAKLIAPQPEAIVAEARAILSGPAVDIPASNFWQRAYHQDVLISICRLREAIQDDCTTAERIALRAIILGALHGPFNKSGTSYLSNQCPRTFAPKPRYAVNFWEKRNLYPPCVNVLAIIAGRAERYYRASHPPVAGTVILGDSRSPSTWQGTSRNISIVITSPPYYGLTTYLPDQWLRLWFLGGPPAVDYSHSDQITHGSPEAFAADLRSVWRQAATVCRAGAKLVVRFGRIESRPIDAQSVLQSSLQNTGWCIKQIRNAGSAMSGRRQADYFLTGRGSPGREFDVAAELEEI